ncbi:hypothetical protein [Duganella sp. CF517]|uniref:hypothetical protein n=1 Tax=Duganella sp. CF517 TaxID=1881038 RepID=UPI0011608690|nr:hypothetical protein [Duganella sp. CF517]
MAAFEITKEKFGATQNPATLTASVAAASAWRGQSGGATYQTTVPAVIASWPAAQAIACFSSL